MKARPSRLAPVARMAVVAGCTLSMVGTTLPTAAFAADLLNVDGTDYVVQASGTGWVWDGDLSLELDGYNGGPIHAEGPLEVTLWGQNVISGPFWAEDGLTSSPDANGDAGIVIAGTEDSSLTIDCMCLAIESSGDIDIHDADIVLHDCESGFCTDGGDIAITDSRIDMASYIHGIYASEGAVTIEGSDVFADMPSHAIEGWEGVSICDSNVTVSKSTQYMEPLIGIASWGGGVEIESSQVDISVSRECGVVGYEGILIQDSNVTICGKSGAEGMYSGAAIQTTGSNVDVTVNGDDAMYGLEVVIDSSNVTVVSRTECFSGEWHAAVEGQEVVIRNGSNVTVDATFALYDVNLTAQAPSIFAGVGASSYDPGATASVEVVSSNLDVNVEVSDELLVLPNYDNEVSLQDVGQMDGPLLADEPFFADEGFLGEGTALEEDPLPSGESASSKFDIIAFGVMAVGYDDEDASIAFEGSTADITAPDAAMAAFCYSYSERPTGSGTVSIVGGEVANHEGEQLYVVPFEDGLPIKTESPFATLPTDDIESKYITETLVFAGQSLATAPLETPGSLLEGSLSPDAVIKAADPKPAPDPTPVNPDVPSLPATSDAASDGAGVLAGGGVMALLSGFFLSLARRTRPAGAHWA